MFILIIIAYVMLFIFDLVPLYKQKYWKDLWINSALGCISLVLAMLLSLGIDIPSPAGPIKDFITSIFGK